MEGLKDKKRGREEPEESPEVKRLREDFLDDLDEEAVVFVAGGQDLDSFMKSFEDEITASPTAADPVLDLTSESGESRTDLGYLLEASDDDLGIPPTAESPSGATSHELVRVDSDASEIGDEFWEIPSYDDSFGLGVGEADNGNYEYVALDGLFDYSEMGFGSGDLLWRPETLPANRNLVLGKDYY